MDQLVQYRALIQEILESHTQIPYKHGNIGFEVVFDEQRDRYLLMLLGRANMRYEHGCMIHIDIIDGKI
ncbi:MAG: XisI protein, partial [Merismopedia sp. SIO2A8]|nr:XisI protein [Merismopedia sp. SIO2A8]